MPRMRCDKTGGVFRFCSKGCLGIKSRFFRPEGAKPNSPGQLPGKRDEKESSPEKAKSSRPFRAGVFPSRLPRAAPRAFDFRSVGAIASRSAELFIYQTAPRL